MAGKAEKTARIEKVTAYLVGGAAPAEIKQAGAKEWGVSEKTVEGYIKSAREIISADVVADKTFALKLAGRRLNMLFSRNMAIKDYKAALSVLQEYNKLHGLHGGEAGKTAGEQNMQADGKPNITAVVRPWEMTG